MASLAILISANHGVFIFAIAFAKDICVCDNIRFRTEYIYILI